MLAKLALWRIWLSFVVLLGQQLPQLDVTRVGDMGPCVRVWYGDVPCQRFVFGPRGRVVPSGRLLPFIVRLTGSFVAGICALLMAR